MFLNLFFVPSFKRREKDYVCALKLGSRMNIIELFEELKIDKNNILLFSAEDIIRIEKQINVEKRINPDINVNVANNLILALKEYREELYFIVSNRILYNLFRRKIIPDIIFLLPKENMLLKRFSLSSISFLKMI